MYLLKYHLYMGNSRFKDTVKVVFEEKKTGSSILFITAVDKICKNFNLTSEEYFNDHSVMRFYKIFMYSKDYEVSCKSLREGTGMRLSDKIYNLLDKSTAVPSNYITYCPICVKEERGYKAIKRYHQVDAVKVCNKHHCYLKKKYVHGNLNELLNIKDWEENVLECTPGSIEEQLAVDVAFIFDNQLDLSREKLEKLIKMEEKEFSRKYPGFIKSKFDGFWKNFYDELPLKYCIYKYDATFERFNGSCDRMPSITEYLVFIRAHFGSFERFVKKYEKYL